MLATGGQRFLLKLSTIILLKLTQDDVKIWCKEVMFLTIPAILQPGSQANTVFWSIWPSISKLICHLWSLICCCVQRRGFQFFWSGFLFSIEKDKKCKDFRNKWVLFFSSEKDLFLSLFTSLAFTLDQMYFVFVKLRGEKKETKQYFCLRYNRIQNRNFYLKTIRCTAKLMNLGNNR